MSSQDNIRMACMGRNMNICAVQPKIDYNRHLWFLDAQYSFSPSVTLPSHSLPTIFTFLKNRFSSNVCIANQSMALSPTTHPQPPKGCALSPDKANQSL